MLGTGVLVVRNAEMDDMVMLSTRTAHFSNRLHEGLGFRG